MFDYIIKVKTISPIHIGIGEAYEPLEYIIDGGYLYEFQETLFFKSLTKEEQQEFVEINALTEVYEFIKKHKELAKKISKNKIAVSGDIQQVYNTIEKPRINPKTKEIMLVNDEPVYNQMNILKTLKSPNTHKAIISGSSFKGVLQTFLNLSIDESKNLIISDSLHSRATTTIGYALTVSRNSLSQSNNAIPQMIEVIGINSEFDIHMKFNQNIDNIIRKADEFYSVANHDLYKSLKQKYVTSNKQFLLRIGRFSGKEFLVPSLTTLPKTKTVFSVSKNALQTLDFGWILCEFKTKDEIEKEEQEKELKIKADQAAKEAAQKAEAEKLAQMSPLDKLIYELDKQKANPNETIDIVIYNAIKEGKLDEFRCEALKRLKQEMQNLKKWAEISKKPSADKKYKRTMEVIKMMEGCTFDNVRKN